MDDERGRVTRELCLEQGTSALSETSGHRHLSRSPIEEATLDVSVEQDGSLTLDSLRAAMRVVENLYPEVHERRRFETSWEVGPDGTRQTASKVQPDGYMGWSADRKDAVQFRVDGFTINRLRPYPGWDVWFQKFAPLWSTYASATHALRVTRIGARCINIVPIDSERRLSDYLTAPPSTPPELRAGVRSFIQRLELSFGEGRNANLVALLQQGPAMHVQLVLDIDAYMNGPFHLDEVEDRFSELHVLRNDCFFSSLTENTIRSFE